MFLNETLKSASMANLPCPETAAETEVGGGWCSRCAPLLWCCDSRIKTPRGGTLLVGYWLNLSSSSLSYILCGPNYALSPTIGIHVSTLLLLPSFTPSLPEDYYCRVDRIVVVVIIIISSSRSVVVVVFVLLVLVQ